MKTIAIRLEDETSELLTLVAQLEGTTQIEQIREAITSHLERKVAGGDLTARAQEPLDEVEREASAWVKRLYYSGMNQLSDLAEAFGVSQAAMTVRLNQIGIVEAPQRCIPANRDWIPQSLDDWANYQRAARVAA